MTQQRLFRLAPETVCFNAVHDPGHGWRLTVHMRRQGEGWDDAHRADYSHLSTSELADVICCEIGTVLELT